jgi:signal transduction histidine kinase
VLANADELRHVFVNLLLNAQDAMVSQSGTITIRTEIERDAVRIQVEDTGSGIRAHILPTVFDPFVTPKKGRGHGLGLANTYVAPAMSLTCLRGDPPRSPRHRVNRPEKTIAGA